MGKLTTKRVIGFIRWRGGTVDPELTIENRLDYATDAFRGGRQKVSEAMVHAAESMEFQMGNNLGMFAKKAVK